VAKKFRPRMVCSAVAAVAGVQAALWFMLWATVGRVPRVRRKAVMMLGLSLGILVEETRALSEATQHDVPRSAAPGGAIAPWANRAQNSQIA
jgi:hypothetical protein